MFTYAYDKAFGIAVTVFSGSTNTDDDYAGFIDLIQKLDALGEGRDQPVFFQIFDSDNPPFPAIWRKRVVEVRAHLKSKPFVLVLAQSRLYASIIWVVNKLDPPPFEQYNVSTFEEGVELVNARRPGTGAILQALHAEARSACASGAAGRPV